MGLSSNILWHQTQKDAFFEILKSKTLRYSYCLERIIPTLPMAIPMISVSDYPFSEIGNNKWTYGDYCIGFNREWGEKVGFSPVWYCSKGSRSLSQLSAFLNNAIKTDSYESCFWAMLMFSYVKFVQAPLITAHKTYKKYRFYDEREWRVVPQITEIHEAGIMPYLTEEGYIEFKEKNNKKSLLELGVNFQYDDIRYIIVKTKEDFIKTKELLDGEIHVFTKDEIIEDVIGINHHEEILPSQIQLDIEAGLRQVKRVTEGFLNRRKKEQTEQNQDNC